MTTDADAVRRTREILRSEGGSLPMAELFSQLFRRYPELRPVIRRAKSGAKKFCERHSREFSVRPDQCGGGGMVSLVVGDARGRGAAVPGQARRARQQIRTITTATGFCRFIQEHPERRVDDRLELQRVFDAWLDSDDCPANPCRTFSQILRSLQLSGILHLVGPAVVYTPFPGWRPQPLDDANPIHRAIAELRKLVAEAPASVHTAARVAQRVDERRRKHEANKGGIKVGPLTLEPTQRPDSTQSSVVTVHNGTDEVVYMLCVAPLRFRNDLHVAPKGPVSLPPDSRIEVTVSCTPTMPQGVMRTVLVFDFGPDIKIGRYLEILITDPADDVFRAQTPFVRHRRRPRRELGEALLEGDRPPGPQIQWTEPLKKYPIPDVIKNGDWRLKNGHPTPEQLDQLQLTAPLSPDNYASRFQQ